MEPIEFERVTIESLQVPQRGEPKQPEARRGQGMNAPRSSDSPTDVRLSEQAKNWLLALPEAVRPNKIAASYPRVVNRLCESWRRPVEMDRYLEDLLTDRRGGRQGFPFSIAQEIASLRGRRRADCATT